MQHDVHRNRFYLACLVGVCLGCSAASAAKPEGGGHGHDKKHKQERAPEIKVGNYFRSEQRAAASDYYDKRHARGRCPPGLAKKHNGCMPPGQAKQWALGQPLPRTVVFYPVPRQVVVQVGTPPPGYRYVRVANDVLLIAIGSQMVVDAIEDLMRL